MKTILTILLTALVFSIGSHRLHSFLSATDIQFFQAGIIHPLIRATNSIDADLREGREEAAREKISMVNKALIDLAENFENFEASHLAELENSLESLNQNPDNE